MTRRDWSDLRGLLLMLVLGGGSIGFITWVLFPALPWIARHALLGGH